MEKLQTLTYVTDLLNHIAILGARTEMRKMGDTPILKYVEKDPEKTQLFLEYVYVGNRVGSGVISGILDKKTIFDTWKPYWWANLWKKLEPLVKQERKRRNDPNLYDQFEKFVKEHCQDK